MVGSDTIREALTPGVDVDPGDVVWLTALRRDRGRAERRLADVLPGRDVGEAAHLAGRLVIMELDREARAKAPVQRDDWIGRILRERDRRRKRREPATRRRWAIMARRPEPGCELVPPPWWGVLSAREPGGYDAGEEWAAMEGPGLPAQW